MKNQYRGWLYHPTEEARIFEAGEEVELGWVDTPDKIGKKPELTITEYKKALTEKGIKFAKNAKLATVKALYEAL